jgi:hypothetical protein
MFVFATVAYTIFVIQDGVLTALHRTALVPLENFVFAAVKLGLVVVVAGVLPWHGIFASWALSLGCAVVVVGIFIFGWAIPRHQRSAAADVDTLPPVRQIVRFVAFDYIGAVLSNGAFTMLPILVIAALGAEQNAYFSIAWLSAYSVHLINVNMGTSLVVEAAVDQSRLARQVRHILAHTSKLLVFVGLALLLCAPYLLGVFGTPIGMPTTRCGFSSWPHCLTCWSRRRSARPRTAPDGACALDTGRAVRSGALAGGLLLPIMGVAGAALAWLATNR